MVMRLKCCTRLVFGTNGSNGRRFAKTFASLVKDKIPNTCKLVLERCDGNSKSKQEYALNHATVSDVHDPRIEEAMLTLVLSHPKVTIFFRAADVIQLKTFCAVLKAIKNDADFKASALLHDTVETKAADWSGSDEVLVVRERRDYPVGRGFNPRLRSVALPGLGLRQLDPRLMRLAHLRELRLPNNKITQLDADLAEALGSRRLEVLDLSHNCLDTFPSITHGPLLSSLRDLDLSGNQIVWLPNSIWLLTSLLRLDLSDNWLDHLPEGITTANTTLQRLSLRANPFPCMPASAQRLRLQHLDLSDPKWPSKQQRIWRGHELYLKASDETPFACRLVPKKPNPYGPLTLSQMCQKVVAMTPRLAKHIPTLPQSLQEELKLVGLCSSNACATRPARVLTAWEPQAICVRLILGNVALRSGGSLIINPDEPATIQERWCLDCYKRYFRQKL